MKLSKKHWIIRWAYFCDMDELKWLDDTNLCSIFWRCVFFSPLKLFVFFTVGCLIGLSFYASWRAALCVYSGVAIIAGLTVWLANRELNISTPRKPSVVVRFIDDLKQKTCTIIQLTED